MSFYVGPITPCSAAEVLSMLLSIDLGMPSTIRRIDSMYHVVYPPTIETEEFVRIVSKYNLRSLETKTSPYTVIHDVRRSSILHLQMFYIFDKI
jgi:hypothetical protein